MKTPKEFYLELHGEEPPKIFADSDAQHVFDFAYAYHLYASDQPNLPTECSMPDVSRQSELLFAFIKAIKEEFKDENWDYLDFIADRVIGKQ